MKELLMQTAPVRKVKRSPWMMLSYQFAILIIYALVVFFVFPYLPGWAIWTTLSLIILCHFFLLDVSCRDPGYVKNDKIDFGALLRKIEPHLLCPDCETIRTVRSRHCSVCGHCVERFDHHCPWINNCVGLNNHHVFYWFILF